MGATGGRSLDNTHITTLFKVMCNITIMNFVINNIEKPIEQIFVIPNFGYTIWN